MAAAVVETETETEEISETEIETENGIVIGNATVEVIEDEMIGTVKAIDETTRIGTVLIGTEIEIGNTTATGLTEEEMAGGAGVQGPGRDLGHLTVMQCYRFLLS